MAGHGPVAPLAHTDPRWLGSYELIGRLGSGGMGTVFLGRGTGGRLVAVKVIKPEFAELPEFRAQFRREGELAQRVARFCTAEVIEVGDADPPYLVTEYVTGPTLSQAVTTGGPLRHGDLERVAVSVAAALAAIHRAGLIHRDLKPANVLLSELGPRVIDFGIARAAEMTTTVNLHLSSPGTPAFMAPEQANGELVTPAADIFAWGGLVAFAGTGRLPFGQGTTPTQLYRVVHGEPTLDGLDGPLLPLVRRAMAKDPAERPTAAELLIALVGLGTQTPDPEVTRAHAVLAGPVPAPPPEPAPPTRPRPKPTPAPDAPTGIGPPAGPPSRPQPRRNRGWIAAAALVAVAVAVALAVIIPTALDRGGGPKTDAQVAAAVDRLRVGDPMLAGRLRLAAYRIAPGPATGDALVSALAAPLSVSATGHTMSVLAVAVSPNGRLAATASADTNVTVWNLASGGPPEPLAVLSGDHGWAEGVTFSPDGRLLASAGADGAVRLWDVTQPRRQHLVAAFTADPTGVRHVVFSPDGRTLAAGGTGGATSLWDVSRPARPGRLAVLTGPTGAVMDVAFSPDGHTLAAASKDSSVHLWDVSRPRDVRLLSIISGHSQFVWSAAFRPDGKVLATASFDGTIRLWDVSAPLRPRQLSVITADHSNVYAAVFTPDGRALLTAGNDTTSHRWDVADPSHPRLVATLAQPERRIPAIGHPDWTQGLAVSPDGKQLLTVYDDASLRVWDIDPAQLAADACRDPTNGLTRSEWKRYVPDRPFRPVC